MEVYFKDSELRNEIKHPLKKISFFNEACFITAITFFCHCIKESASEIKLEPMKMKNDLNRSGIVPDIIDVFPENVLQIEYENHKEVAFGNDMSRWDTFDRPVKISYPAEPDAYYALIMTDPDCPSREIPTHREWQHWILVNIPGANWTQGFCLTEYIGILGYYEHAIHRYVFLLYKQPGKLKFTERVLDPRPVEMLRYKFSTRNFAKKYNFGDPLAVNFFMSEAVLKSTTAVV
ncbi:protein D3 isoform X1 [Bemisia tabaci]|uniref:protein D3 isoform X1 n=1 Tax=Bemisia tabaci TaxID=7038 RepID=UPI003B28849B